MKILKAPSIPGVAFWGDESSGGSLQFTYQPGGTTSGQVYATWAELDAALLAAPAGIRFVTIDDSITSPAPVDVGAWAGLANCIVQGAPNNINTQRASLDFAAGASITALPLEWWNLSIYVEGPDDAYNAAPGESDTYTRMTGCAVYPLTTGAFLHAIASGATIHVRATDVDFTSSPGTAACLQGDNAYIDLQLFDGSTVADDSLGCDVTGQVTVYVDGTSTLSATQTGILGGYYPTFERFEVKTSGWSAPITALGATTSFSQSLAVPQNVVNPGVTLEIDTYIDTLNGNGGQFTLLINGVTVAAQSIKYTAGAWAFRCILRITNVGPTGQAVPAPTDDVIYAVRCEYTEDTGTGPRQVTVAYQYDAILVPLPAVTLTDALVIQPQWKNDGPGAAHTYLRSMTARILN